MSVLSGLFCSFRSTRSSVPSAQGLAGISLTGSSRNFSSSRISAEKLRSRVSRTWISNPCGAAPTNSPSLEDPHESASAGGAEIKRTASNINARASLVFSSAARMLLAKPVSCVQCPETPRDRYGQLRQRPARNARNMTESPGSNGDDEPHARQQPIPKIVSRADATVPSQRRSWPSGRGR